MRFVKLQVALLLLAVSVVGAVAADMVLKGRAEVRLEAEVLARSPDASGVRGRIRSFPFLARLLTSGQVSEVDITAQHANPGGVVLSDLVVRLDEVELDVDQAKKGRAVVRSIGRGSVRVSLGQDQINARLPRPVQVQLQEGRAVITGPGGAQGTLVLTPEGAVQVRIANRTVLDLRLPATNLVPCRPTAVFVPGALRLSCTFTEVPELFRNLTRG